MPGFELHLGNQDPLRACFLTSVVEIVRQRVESFNVGILLECGQDHRVPADGKHSIVHYYVPQL